MNTNITHRKTPEPHIIQEAWESITLYEEKYLKVRDDWIEGASDYIDEQCEEIGLIDNGKEALGDLYFALATIKMTNGELWLKDYMKGTYAYEILDSMAHSEKELNDMFAKINLLLDLTEHPDIIGRLNIDMNLLYDYANELNPKSKYVMEVHENKPLRVSADIHINRCASTLFKIMDEQRKNKTLSIGTNEQVQFVLDTYQAWEYAEYDVDGLDIEDHKKEDMKKILFGRLFTQRTRALE